MERTSLTSGLRRKLVLGVAIVAGLSALGLVPVLTPAASAAPTVHTNLFQYTLFAQRSLQFKGRNVSGGIVSNGDIGVNLPGGTMNICNGNHSLTMDPGSQVVADQMRVDSDCVLNQTDAFTSVKNAPNVKATFATINTMTFPAGGYIPTVPGDANYPYLHPSWPAGCSGDLFVKDGDSASITTDGLVFCTAKLGKGATLEIGSNVHAIWVLGDAQFSNNSVVRFADPATADKQMMWFVRGDNVKSNDSTVQFGRQAEFSGNIDAILGTINLGNATTLNGHFFANDIGSDFRDTVNSPGTTTTSMTVITIPT